MSLLIKLAVWSPCLEGIDSMVHTPTNYIYATIHILYLVEYNCETIFIKHVHYILSIKLKAEFSILYATTDYLLQDDPILNSLFFRLNFVLVISMFMKPDLFIQCIKSIVHSHFKL